MSILAPLRAQYAHSAHAVPTQCARSAHAVQTLSLCMLVACPLASLCVSILRQNGTCGLLGDEPIFLLHFLCRRRLVPTYNTSAFLWGRWSRGTECVQATGPAPRRARAVLVFAGPSSAGASGATVFLLGPMLHFVRPAALFVGLRGTWPQALTPPPLLQAVPPGAVPRPFLQALSPTHCPPPLGPRHWER